MPAAPTVPDYTVSRCTVWDHILAFLVGSAAGFLVLFIFYKIILLSILGGAVTGVVNIFAAEQRTLQKRIRHLRTQFFDLLEAMSVAMRAGNPVLKALESARDDLLLIHGEGSASASPSWTSSSAGSTTPSPCPSPLPTWPGAAAWRISRALPRSMPPSRVSPAGPTRSSGRPRRSSRTRWRSKWRSIP